MNLISPRYFENIASGCQIITEKNNELKEILPKYSYIEFSNDLSNFDQVLNKGLLKFNYSKKTLKKNSAIVKNKHSWKVRTKMVLKIIKIFLKQN